MVLIFGFFEEMEGFWLLKDYTLKKTEMARGREKETWTSVFQFLVGTKENAEVIM